MTPDAQQTNSQLAFSIAQFAQVFCVGRSMIYEEIRAGRLKIRKVGARTLITRDDGLAWLGTLPTRSPHPSAKT